MDNVESNQTPIFLTQDTGFISSSDSTQFVTNYLNTDLPTIPLSPPTKG